MPRPMPRPMHAMLAVASLAAAGCADPGRPTAPDAAPLAARNGSTQEVRLLDDCDPATFNAAVGPNTCVRAGGGGTTFQRFLAELQERGAVGAWRFNPDDVAVASRATLLLVNRGGETHTFTRVAAFGNGFIPALNVRSDQPWVPVAECVPSQLGPTDFIPTGGTASTNVGAEGTARYQCCIHPWMRTTVHVGHE